MVVHTSDSCNTLISLDLNGKKHSEPYDCVQIKIPQTSYRPTDLLLPEDCCDHQNSDDTRLEQPLYLPVNTTTTTEDEPIDVFLRSIPRIRQRADELLASPARILDASGTGSTDLNPTASNFSCKNDSFPPCRILYVAQGELAHATPSQCDVVVSDKATTCHILAVHSTHGCSREPLVSLTHLDAAGYEACLRNMVREHKLHHHDVCDDEFQEEKKEDTPSDTRIRMQVHVMGGYEEDQSRDISNFLVNLLARIASEERDSIRMVLQTCAVSSLNGHTAPIGRGLGIDTRTGHVFLAKVSDNCVGPCPELRSLRLWCGGDDEATPKRLSVIHTSRSDYIQIEPFQFEPFKEIDVLLSLPDSVMLEYVSTSPAVEEDDFCDKIRSTLRFLKRHASSREIFQDSSSPLLYRRVMASNEWSQMLAS